MRVGKKLNILDTKKTRSCVVRLEKLSHESLSPTPPPTSRRSLNTSQPKVQQQQQQKGEGASTRQPHSAVSGGGGGVMGATPKQPSTAAQSRDGKNFKGPIKKRPVGSNPQTPQQKQAANMSALRSNQKIKVIPRANRSLVAAVPPPKEPTPVREETPTPTIAAGRSRRAIKPNPKYASEDIVTPKMVRNVGGAFSTSKSSTGGDGKRRKASTSSDDFYNRNSDDDFDDDFRNMNSNDDVKGDKAYKVDEREDDLDSDLSEIEEELSKRVVRMRGRPRKQEATLAQNTKFVNQTPTSNVRRLFNPPGATVRNAPTQLQQLRRSLQSANTQRNQSLLSGSMAQKRKLPDPHDSDSESTYTVARKQILVTTSSGLKVRMPVKENSATSTLPNRQRILGLQKMTSSGEGKLSLNGGNRTINSQLIEKRRIIESTKTSQDTPPKMTMRTLPTRQHQHTMGSNKMLTSTRPGSAAQNATPHQKTIMGSSVSNSSRLLRTSSPKPLLKKETAANSMKLLTATTTTGPSSAQHQKKLPTLPTKPIEKLKSALASTVSNAAPLPYSKTVNSKAMHLTSQSNSNTAASTKSAEDSIQANDESPNSTMDDFETMPTFTIVNVNDIINKKGDVLITKSKGNSVIKPTVIEFSESISLDEDDDDGDDEDEDINDVKKEQGKCNKREAPPPKITKLPTVNNRVEPEKKKLPLARNNNNEAARKQQSTAANSSLPSNMSGAAKPQILNHRLGLRNNPRVTAKTTTPVSSTPDKPAPRILNSVVAKKTQPVKPMITNLDDSAEESFPLSLDEEETEDEAERKSFEQPEKNTQYPMDLDLDSEDTDSQNSEQDEPTTKALTPKNNTTSNTGTSPPSSLSAQRKKRLPNQSTPIVVTSNKKRILTPAAAKENSLAAINQQVNDTKASSPLIPQTRKQPAEKVVISKQGDKIIKKITCFETWYVINMPLEPKRQTLMKNQLDIPLINLANNARTINLPSDSWSCKVTLYELSAMTLAKSTFVTYTGDLEEYNIHEEDRAKYQPSCVMFRRSIENRQQSRMPYDRAVIFKNKTFSTNIEGKNIRLVGAPSIISSERDIEILLEVVDALTLQSDFVEYATMVQ